MRPTAWINRLVGLASDGLGLKHLGFPAKSHDFEDSVIALQICSFSFSEVLSGTSSFTSSFEGGNLSSRPSGSIPIDHYLFGTGRGLSICPLPRNGVMIFGRMSTVGWVTAATIFALSTSSPSATDRASGPAICAPKSLGPHATMPTVLMFPALASVRTCSSSSMQAREEGLRVSVISAPIRLRRSSHYADRANRPYR